MSKPESRYKRCPFCDTYPHHGLTKVEYDQLHGEPFQRFRIQCPRGHASITEMSEEQARSVWNSRAALGSQAAAPDGWVMVPKPELWTEAMREAYSKAEEWNYDLAETEVNERRLSASFDAAPPAPLPAHEAVPEWAQKEIKRLRKAEAASESTFKHWRERALKAEATSPADSQERLGKLAAAATAFLDMYVGMVNSGDCGFWNPEEVPEVINLRAALATKDGETGTPIMAVDNEDSGEIT